MKKLPEGFTARCHDIRYNMGMFGADPTARLMPFDSEFPATTFFCSHDATFTNGHEGEMCALVPYAPNTLLDVLRPCVRQSYS
jgi:hypothetical protein